MEYQEVKSEILKKWWKGLDENEKYDIMLAAWKKSTGKKFRIDYRRKIRKVI